MAKRMGWICVWLTLCLAQVVAQEHSRMERINNKKVNFGFRAGFNSSMYLVSDFKINDVTIKEIHNTTFKIGYYGTAFARLNFEKHYLQPELSYQVSRCEITFDKLGSQHPNIDPNYATIHSKIHSLEMPVLYGYNIIKEGPYGLSVFGGAKVKFLWNNMNRITFENFDQKDIKEELYPITLSVTAGVAVNISNVFFDFRYEQGLRNISKSVTYADMESSESGRMTLNRRENILSFSLGIMF